MAKLAATVAICVLAVLPLAGCSDDNAKGSDDPAPTAPTTTLKPTPTTPAPTTAAWRDKYTAEQLDAYDAALARWQEYTKKTNAIYMAGRDTSEARAVFRDYSMKWQGLVKVLAETYDAGRVRKERPTKPLSTRAQLVRLNADGTGSVTIWQCTDYSDVLVTQNGQPVAGTKPDHLITPLIIHMAKPEGRDWMVADTELKDKASCAG